MKRRSKARKKKKFIARYVVFCLLLVIVGFFSGKYLLTKFYSPSSQEETVLAGNSSSDEEDSSSDDSKSNSTDKDSKSSNEEANNNIKNGDKSPLNQNNQQEIDPISDSKKVKDMLKSGVYTSKEKKIAYLTFDDGPSVTVTPKILDILNQNKIHGTFFIVGSELDKSDKAKDLLKRIVNDGNTLANHTYSHNYKTLYPGGHVNAAAFMDEVERTNKLITDVVGEKYKPRVVRFPGGHASWKGTEEVDRLLDEKGYVYIDWNALVGDAEVKHRNKEELIQRFNQTKTENAKNGDLVVLMHDTYGKESTAEALPQLINELRNEGYEFHTLM